MNCPLCTTPMETHTIMASDDPIVRTEHACPQCSLAGDTACVEAVARLKAERDACQCFGAMRIKVDDATRTLAEAERLLREADVSGFYFESDGCFVHIADGEDGQYREESALSLEARRV